MYQHRHILIYAVFLLLLIGNSAGAVWIYTDVDILVGDITLNTVTDQNFTYVEIGDTYTNLSWDGSTYHNISFVNNIQASITSISEGTSTTITFDTYSPAAWTMHNINMSFITANDTIDSTETPTASQYNSTHKRYTYAYTPSGLVDADFGYFDVNVSLWTSNTTLTYNGSKLFSNVFQVGQCPNVTTNATTGVEETNATLHGYLVDDGGNNCTCWFEYGTTTSYGSRSFYASNNQLNSTHADSSSGSQYGRTIENALDGVGNWQDGNTPPYWFIIDLAANKQIVYVKSRSMTSQDPTSVDVYVSEDKTNWGTPVISSTSKWQDTEEWTEVTFLSEEIGRYLLFNVNSVENGVWVRWGTSSIAGYISILQIGYSTDVSSNSTFCKNITDILPGTLYHYRAVADNTYCTSYGSDMTFLTKPNAPPTSLTCTSSNDSQAVLSWTKESTCNKTVIRRNTGSYPASPTSGTEIYNGTGTTVTDTGLTYSTKYYYRAWSYVEWGSLYHFSDGNASVNVSTNPLPPTNLSWSLDIGTTTANLTLNWTKGLGSNYTLIRRKATTYPTSITDGTEVYNSTINGTIDVDITQSYKYRMWAYNSTTGLYSVYADSNWSATWINVYNESNPSQAVTDWDIEISSQDGSEVYTSIDNNNSLIINLSNLPTGDNVAFIISASGYKQRSYYYDVDGDEAISFDAYLPPTWTSQDDDDTPPDEQTLMSHSDTAAVTNPSVDVNVTLDHIPEEITAVYVYNSSIYGGWVPIAEDYYSYNSSTSNVTIDASVLDVNSSLVRVDYTSYESRGATETEVYLLTVVNTIGTRLTDVKISVLRYMNTTGKYEEVGSVLTDGNGEATMYLIPDVHYKVNVSKDGYITAISDYIPTLAVRTKTFQMVLEDVDTDKTNWINYVAMSATMSELGILSISYTDSLSNTTSVNVTVYLWNGSAYNSTVYYYNSSSSSFTTSTTVNNSYGYKVVFNISHGDFDDFSHTIMINRHFSTSMDDLNDMFESVLGINPFGWVNFLALIVLLACLLAFGEAGAGISLLGAGFVFLFLNILIVGFIASTIIPILFIVLGMLVEWKHARKG